jgi:hypothetical protein
MCNTSNTKFIFMSNLLEQASLVMIPSGYKEDVVYSEIPLDGSGDLSLTRASNGTRVNFDGVVEVVPWNLVEYSEDLTNAYWSKDPGVVINSNVATAPNGTTTADRANYSGTGISFYRIETFSGANTFSVYLKGEGANIGKQLELEINNSGGTINVTLTGDWVRYETNANNANAVAIKRRTSGQADSALVWGIQVNQGALKPYFPTTDRLNVPRLTYQNGGGGCPSLLLEKQSTNLVTYSEDFTQWSGANVSVTANNTTSPDGTQNADLITATSGTIHDVFNTFNGGTTNTISIFVKKGTSQYVYFSTSYQSTTSDNCCILVDLDNKTLINQSSGNVAFVSGSVVDMGNGWVRVICTTTAASATGMYLFAGISSTYTFNLSLYGRQVSTTSQTAYFYGAQCEVSSYPTSYIPTTSASATRVADGPVNLSTTQTLTNFTLFYDGLIFQNGENMLFGSGNSAWYIDIDGSTGRVVLDLASGRIYNAFSSLTSNQRFKLAVKRSAGVVDAFVNGTKLTPNTQVTDTTSLTLSSITWAFSSTFYPKMKVNEICAFQSALSDSDCQALTTL